MDRGESKSKNMISQINDVKNKCKENANNHGWYVVWDKVGNSKNILSIGELGKKGETYDEIIERLLQLAESENERR